MPLQLSCLDHCDCGSRPGDAEQGVVGVEAGDVVVVGSDGLWDNLWEHQLLAALREEQQQVRGSWAGLLVVRVALLGWQLGCTAGLGAGLYCRKAGISAADQLPRSFLPGSLVGCRPLRAGSAARPWLSGWRRGWRRRRTASLRTAALCPPLQWSGGSGQRQRAWRCPGRVASRMTSPW